MGVDSRMLAKVIGAWVSNQRPKFLTQSLIGN